MFTKDKAAFNSRSLVVRKRVGLVAWLYNMRWPRQIQCRCSFNLRQSAVWKRFIWGIFCCTAQKDTFNIYTFYTYIAPHWGWDYINMSTGQILCYRRFLHIVHAQRLKSSKLSQFHLINPSTMKLPMTFFLPSTVWYSLKALAAHSSTTSTKTRQIKWFSKSLKWTLHGYRLIN